QLDKHNFTLLMLAIYHGTTQRRKHSNVKDAIMDEREYRRRIRRNRIAQEEKKRIRQQLRQTMVVCALACVMLLVCCLWSAEPTYAKTNAATASGSCAVLMRWPLNGAQVVGKYDAPKQQWLPGHRGVDLLADPQEAIVAPADGVIAFSGNVGGKAVVTIRHGGDLSGLCLDVRARHCRNAMIGAHVAQGSVFARVGGRIRPFTPSGACIGG
ncbi:MAG: M23 family metallopeptidase, partial [Bifidobacterium pseudocatenulatum]